jgi:hypothetical protein
LIAQGAATGEAVVGKGMQIMERQHVAKVEGKGTIAGL